MLLENLTCFGCGGKGHIEKDCPKRAIVPAVTNTASPIPPWCGRCDRHSRLIEIHGLASRCQECHPLALDHIGQCVRCPDCRMLVYEWDRNPCRRHASPAAADSRLPREEIDAIFAREAVRSAESLPEAS